MSSRIRIGYRDTSFRKKLYFPGDSHVILTAPSGSGKGRDLIVPALLDFPGSCIVVDPKGQDAAITAHHRQSMGQQVYDLNPLGILKEELSGLTHVGFNPLSVLNRASPSFGADCDSLAEAIVYEEGGGDARFFVDSARQAVSGVIMAVVKYSPPELRHLLHVADTITGEKFFQFCRASIRANDFLLNARLARFAVPKAESNRTLSGILETARTAFGFLANRAIAQSLIAGGSEPVPDFATLRKKPTTVYLILPTKYLKTCTKWFRLVIAAAMDSLLVENGGNVPVLAVLDEFAQLGTLQVMSDMMGVGRGYGVQLWPILQDLSQLEELYPKRWETFLQNSGARIFFAPRDVKTAEYVSKMTGVKEVPTSSRGINEQAFGPKETVNNVGFSTNSGQGQRPLLYPHEVRELPESEMLVFGENLPGVIRAGRRPYWKMPECRGKFAVDPYHVQAKSGFRGNRGKRGLL